ncbi:hypothetical protein R3P38DRAFT_3569733 [Favolaschia claudopus]|uniref:TEA domain-containing protein n=1 Tax=Favolaschia claudopus TaxID=2862362 RepID=A0AAW0ASJ0_9AGAR
MYLEATGSSTGCGTPATPASALPFGSEAYLIPSSSTKSQTTQEVLQFILNVRKRWKTSRIGEAIWPLELESALLDGLEKYQPNHSHQSLRLGRFCGRNRFISDYIFNKTGRRRSNKQVATRLGQLKEWSGECQVSLALQLLLYPTRIPEPSVPVAPTSSGSSIGSAESFPILPSGNEDFPGQFSGRNITIYIDILPKTLSDSQRSPFSFRLDTGDGFHVTDHPRPLETIEPAVGFAAHYPVAAYSRYSVYEEAEDIVIHSENVPLALVAIKGSQRQEFFYSAQLIPRYWKVIVDSPDPTRFTITQEIAETEGFLTLFSATYKFVYPQSTTNCAYQRSSVFSTPLWTAAP